MKKKKDYSIVGIIILAIIGIAAVVGLESAFSFNDTTYMVMVTDKERIVQSNGEKSSSKYLVYCEDVDGNTLVFENTDKLIRGKFNSSDFQGKLKVGETYELTVIGYRVPIVSMYQNIIEIKEVGNITTNESK